MRTPRQFYWKGLHVPFIAPWSRESSPVSAIIRVGQGIGYADEFSAADRRHGTLWIRQAAVRGAGDPELAGVHPLRQRQAMSHMLCQVCGTSTFDSDFVRWGERHLFLVRAVGGRPIGEGERTTTPPVCRTCAIESVGACPHLRKGYTAALVKRAQPWGVAGIVYDPLTLKPTIPDSRLTEASFTSPLIRWTLAARDVATLHGCTTIDLAQLAVAA
ncbi:hypothetical protein ABZ707_32180 [Streptomyces sp. NPDC006923]|uniref:hypothetical protein n=1 Tax=Streptomyces sp. NPDC006923 TaxID=3155355 RepID=UPI0033EE844A